MRRPDELVVTLWTRLRVRIRRRQYVTRCDGIPFYIEQIVAGLAETGVPEPLYEPLFAQLRTSANVVPLVEAAGVIGRYVDRRLLRAVVDHER